MSTDCRNMIISKEKIDWSFMKGNPDTRFVHSLYELEENGIYLYFSYSSRSNMIDPDITSNISNKMILVLHCDTGSSIDVYRYDGVGEPETIVSIWDDVIYADPEYNGEEYDKLNKEFMELIVACIKEIAGDVAAASELLVNIIATYKTLMWNFDDVPEDIKCKVVNLMEE